MVTKAPPLRTRAPGWLPALLLAGCAATTPPSLQPGDSLTLLAPAPAPAWPAVVTDFEGRQAWAGVPLQVPKPAQPRVPASRVWARPADKDARGDAVVLQFQDTWIAQLRFEGGPPVDLRSYLPTGTLEFDLDVRSMPRGGLKFKMGCGERCERKLPWLAQARSAAGQGWQHLSFALSCFARPGDDYARVPLPFALEATGTGEVAVANVRLQRHGVASTPCPDHRTAALTPMPLLESWAIDWWMPRHEQKLAEIRAHREAGRQVDLVFIGDSITGGWEDAGRAVWQREYARHNAVGLGFGGDRTENVLWRLQHGELEGMSPRVVVLMIGTNNTGERQDPADVTAEGIRLIVDEIRTRQPAAQVLLLAIYPRERKPGPLRALNSAINDRIRHLADGRQVHFLDIGSRLTNPDGTLPAEVMPDELHLSEHGYDLVARAIAPTLSRLLAR